MAKIILGPKEIKKVITAGIIALRYQEAVIEDETKWKFSLHKTSTTDYSLTIEGCSEEPVSPSVAEPAVREFNFGGEDAKDDHS